MVEPFGAEKTMFFKIEMLKWVNRSSFWWIMSAVLFYNCQKKKSTGLQLTVNTESWTSHLVSANRDFSIFLPIIWCDSDAILHFSQISTEFVRNSTQNGKNKFTVKQKFRMILKVFWKSAAFPKLSFRKYAKIFVFVLAKPSDTVYSLFLTAIHFKCTKNYEEETPNGREKFRTRPTENQTEANYLWESTLHSLLFRRHFDLFWNWN